MTRYVASLCILLLIALSACASSPTGSATADTTNQTNTSKKITIPDEKVVLKDAVNATKACTDQIAELKKRKTKDEYAMLLVKGEQQKLSRELQYKKDNRQFEGQVEEMVNKLKEISDESSRLKKSISDAKDAVRILEEKCNMKSVGV